MFYYNEQIYNQNTYDKVYKCNKHKKSIMLLFIDSKEYFLFF